MTYYSLPLNIQSKIQSALARHFGSTFVIDSRDEFYSKSGMRYGYVAINERQREVLVCDCTPDDGDTLISTIRF